MLYFQHSKIFPNLKENVQLFYLVADAYYGSRRLFNISTMSFNISMMIPTIFISIVGYYIAIIII